MKKKILIIGYIIILTIILVILTGCGESKLPYNQNDEYAKYIEAIRNGKMTYLNEDRTIGELLDNALENSRWTHNTNYVPNGNEVPISITGTSKSTGEDIEIIYTVREDTLKYSFQSITINGVEGTLNEMIDLIESPTQ